MDNLECHQTDQPVCEVRWLGVMPYQETWDLQNQFAGEIARGERLPTLLLLEHPHTFTFGRRGDQKNLLWDEAEQARREVSVYWVDRGGDVTYHGPGQLVGYPLLPLGRGTLVAHASQETSRLPQADYVGYLRKLERTLIRALAEFGIRSHQLPGLTGVWVQSNAAGSQPGGDPQAQSPPAKIASIGVKVDANGVTRHGFALNVSPDLSYWEGIIGCGLDGYSVTSLAELSPQAPSMQSVVAAVSGAFSVEFAYNMHMA